MAAGVWNPTIEQGANWSRTITWLDSDADDADPVDLTGFTARMQVKEQTPGVALADVDPWVELTTENGRITLGDVDGTIALSLSASVTAGLAAPGYKLVFDLELVNGSAVTRLLEGTVTFSPEVTT